MKSELVPFPKLVKYRCHFVKTNQTWNKYSKSYYYLWSPNKEIKEITVSEFCVYFHSSPGSFLPRWPFILLCLKRDAGYLYFSPQISQTYSYWQSPCLYLTWLAKHLFDENVVLHSLQTMSRLTQCMVCKCTSNFITEENVSLQISHFLPCLLPHIRLWACKLYRKANVESHISHRNFVSGLWTDLICPSSSRLFAQHLPQSSHMCLSKPKWTMVSWRTLLDFLKNVASQ